MFEPIERRNVTPSEAEIRDALRRMGKTKPEDELNCGSCGYNTCREKAIAICHGKAEVSMPALPQGQGESFSDIVNNTPTDLSCSTNRWRYSRSTPPPVGCSICVRRQTCWVIRSSAYGSGALPQGVGNAPGSAGRARTSQSISGCRADHRGGRRQSPAGMHPARRDRRGNGTREERDISRRTAEIADRVVDKQMRIVQEIASLLGETAAETKIALTKLKESISDE